LTVTVVGEKPKFWAVILALDFNMVWSGLVVAADLLFHHQKPIPATTITTKTKIKAFIFLLKHGKGVM